MTGRSFGQARPGLVLVFGQAAFDAAVREVDGG